MLFCLSVTLYFLNIKYFIENDVKCIVVKQFKDENVVVGTYNDIEKVPDNAISVMDVSSSFDFVLDIVCIQAFIMFTIAFCNFLSHYFIP